MKRKTCSRCSLQEPSLLKDSPSSPYLYFRPIIFLRTSAYNFLFKSATAFLHKNPYTWFDGYGDIARHVLPIVNYQRAWGTKEKFPIGGLPPLSLRPFILSSQYPSAFFNTSEWALSKRGPSIILTLSLSYFLYSKFFLSGKGKERVHEKLWAPDEGRGLLE